MRELEIHACTDITGFGLLGHAYEIAHGGGVRLDLDASKLPLLPQARELAASGTSTGGCRRNRDWLADKVSIAPGVPTDLVELAFDPQTSGGLLFAIAPTDAARALEALRSAKTPAAAAIGHAASQAAGPWVALR